MIPKPVVSLHGGGESVVLSNRAGRFILAHGVDGLGVAPQELTTAGLASGGSLLRHRRSAEAVVNVPIVLGGDYAQRWEDRRLLERVCDGLVEVRVAEPAGFARSRFGYYQEGLGGDTADEFVDGQKLVLSLLCTDPLWYGEEQAVTWFISQSAKPLIGGGSFFPIVLQASVVAGEREVIVEGDAGATPEFSVAGPGEFLTIENHTTGQRFRYNGELTGVFHAAGDDVSMSGTSDEDLWRDVPPGDEVPTLVKGPNRVSVQMSNADPKSSVRMVWRNTYRSGH